MKKILTIPFSILAFMTFAQVPQGLNYQAVARDNDGQPKQNVNMDVRFTILQDSVNGTPIYSESQPAQTNDFGLFTLTIGQGITTDTFSNIDWANGKKFLGVEIDNQLSGITQLLSVPYSLFAGKAGSVSYWEQIGLQKIYTPRKTGIGVVPGNSTQFEILGNTVGMPFLQGNILKLSSTNSEGGFVFGKLDVDGTSFIQSSKANAVSTLSLNPEGGNVNIGLSNNNSSILTVNGIIQSNGNVNSNSNTSGGAGFLANGLQSDASYLLLRGHVGSFNNITSSWSIHRAGFDKNKLSIRYGETQNNPVYLTIDTTGNVGIGTTNPQTDLDIKGKIKLNASGALGTGIVSTIGENGNINVLLTSAFNNPNGGYVAVIDANGMVQAGMRVNADGQGEIFSDVKNFQMPYPNKPDKEIWYACIEGPEAAAYERGTIQLQNGQATVVFSPHFQEVINSSTMTVQAIPLSADSKGIAIVEKNNNGFMVKELWNGVGNYKVDWEVKAVRKGYENYKVIRQKDENLPLFPNSEPRN